MQFVTVSNIPAAPTLRWLAHKSDFEYASKGNTQEEQLELLGRFSDWTLWAFFRKGPGGSIDKSMVSIDSVILGDFDESKMLPVIVTSSMINNYCTTYTMPSRNGLWTLAPIRSVLMSTRKEAFGLLKCWDGLEVEEWKSETLSKTTEEFIGF